MYKDDAVTSRKFAVMLEAGKRYAEKRPELAETAAKLAKGGPMVAASPGQRTNYAERESVKLFKAIVQPTVAIIDPFIERRVGPTYDWEQIAPNPEARRAGRPVARLVSLDERRIVDGFATGFLIAPGLLVTNWHVFDAPEDTRSCGAQFNYEFDVSGNSQPTVVFEFDPQRFFYSNKDLDIAIVALADRPLIGTGALSDFSEVRLIPTLGKILVGQPVNIIQHPGGQVKHYALQKNTVYLEPAESDRFLMYTTDTLEGSSGSPAFNRHWELVAVHHGGVPEIQGNDILTVHGTVWHKGLPDTDIHWVANEGARVSQILTHLRGVQLVSPVQQAILQSVLGEARDVAPETLVPSTVPNATAAFANLSSQGEASMNITVNGTANFYLGGASTSVSTPPSSLAAHVVAPVAIEKKLRFDPTYSKRKGYSKQFLEGFTVPAPTAPEGEVYEWPKGPELRYYHYSVVMHKDRRLALWTASNVDYDPDKRRSSREEFGNDEWKADPRIPIEQQVEDLEFYAPAKKFDRGHLVRRDDSAWGETPEEEEFANADTFHWTNCTPQHEQFNRNMFQYHGLWGGLENHIAKQAQFVDNRLIVFAGPILADEDPEHDFGSGVEVKMPVAFWKVVVVVEGQGDSRKLRAYGFILDQSEAIDRYGLERRDFRPSEFVAVQHALSEITERSRVEFDESLHAADPMAGGTNESRRVLVSLDALQLG